MSKPERRLVGSNLVEISNLKITASQAKVLRIILSLPLTKKQVEYLISQIPGLCSIDEMQDLISKLNAIVNVEPR